jgi:hypothetical protein
MLLSGPKYSLGQQNSFVQYSNGLIFFSSRRVAVLSSVVSLVGDCEDIRDRLEGDVASPCASSLFDLEHLHDETCFQLVS